MDCENKISLFFLHMMFWRFIFFDGKCTSKTIPKANKNLSANLKYSSVSCKLIAPERRRRRRISDSGEVSKAAARHLYFASRWSIDLIIANLPKICSQRYNTASVSLFLGRGGECNRR